MPSGRASKTFSFGALSPSAALRAAAASNTAANRMRVFIYSLREKSGLAGLLRNNLRLLGGLGRVMHHGVGVFHAHAVSAGLRFEQAHEVVVMFLVLPITLPFEQSLDGCHAHRTGLHHA